MRLYHLTEEEKKERLRQQIRDWQKRNIEKHRASGRKTRMKLYYKNPEADKERSRKWKENNIEKSREISRNCGRKQIAEINDTYLFSLFHDKYPNQNRQDFDKVKDVLRLQLEIKREIKLQKQSNL